jgi:RNA polymerase sigma-70 factor (ECF subfamily)
MRSLKVTVGQVSPGMVSAARKRRGKRPVNRDRRRAQVFDQLKQFIWGQSDIPSQKEVAARINMTEGAVNVAVHRLRHRYRELLREEIAQTLANPADVDDELRHLKSALNR